MKQSARHLPCSKQNQGWEKGLNSSGVGEFSATMTVIPSLSRSDKSGCSQFPQILGLLKKLPDCSNSFDFFPVNVEIR